MLFSIISFIFAGLLYFTSVRNGDDVIKNIKNVPFAEVGPRLEMILQNSGAGSIPYMAISGSVKQFHEVIESGGLVGVILKTTKTEHYTDRTTIKDKWSDNKIETLSTEQIYVPFGLQELSTKSSKMMVEISEPLKAEFESLLKESSVITTPIKSTRDPSKELKIVKNIQVKEELLATGTIITAFGRISRGTNGMWTLFPSMSLTHQPFILTSRTFEGYISHREFQLLLCKGLTLLLILAGIGFFIHALWLKFRGEKLSQAQKIKREQ